MFWFCGYGLFELTGGQLCFCMQFECLIGGRLSGYVSKW